MSRIKCNRHDYSKVSVNLPSESAAQDDNTGDYVPAVRPLFVYLAKKTKQAAGTNDPGMSSQNAAPLQAVFSNDEVRVERIVRVGG